jgi:hypothetical protein
MIPNPIKALSLSLPSPRLSLGLPSHWRYFEVRASEVRRRRTPPGPRLDGDGAYRDTVTQAGNRDFKKRDKDGRAARGRFVQFSNFKKMHEISGI